MVPQKHNQINTIFDKKVVITTFSSFLLLTQMPKYAIIKKTEYYILRHQDLHTLPLALLCMSFLFISTVPARYFNSFFFNFLLCGTAGSSVLHKKFDG